MLFAWFRDYPQEAELLAELCARWRPGGVQVVELGCGTGNLALELARRGYSITGIDRSQDMLAIARQKAARLGLPLEVELGDLTEGASLASGLRQRFDLAYASFSLVFNFFPRRLLHNFFATCSALLRPQGLLIVNGFCVEKTKRDHPHGKYRVRGVNPYENNTLRTFIRAIYQRCLVTLVFYHRLECLGSLRITTHTLRPYSIDELTDTAQRWGYRYLEAIGYPQLGPFRSGRSDEFFLVYEFVGR